MTWSCYILYDLGAKNTSYSVPIYFSCLPEIQRSKPEEFSCMWWLAWPPPDKHHVKVSISTGLSQTSSNLFLPTMTSTQNGDNGLHPSESAGAQLRPEENRDSLMRRSWYSLLSPFSSSALASLPNVRRPARHLRADNIPESTADDNGERPTVRDYHSINSLPPKVHVPKKIATTVKVEGKVWFANERSASWFCISQKFRTQTLQHGFHGLAFLFFLVLFPWDYSTRPKMISHELSPMFMLSLVYASWYVLHLVFSCFWLLKSTSKLYGYFIYQHRITMIRRRDPGHFGTEHSHTS